MAVLLTTGCGGRTYQTTAEMLAANPQSPEARERDLHRSGPADDAPRLRVGGTAEPMPLLPAPPDVISHLARLAAGLAISDAEAVTILEAYRGAAVRSEVVAGGTFHQSAPVGTFSVRPAAASATITIDGRSWTYEGWFHHVVAAAGALAPRSQALLSALGIGAHVADDRPVAATLRAGTSSTRYMPVSVALAPGGLTAEIRAAFDATTGSLGAFFQRRDDVSWERVDFAHLYRREALSTASGDVSYSGSFRVLRATQTGALTPALRSLAAALGYGIQVEGETQPIAVALRQDDGRRVIVVFRPGAGAPDSLVLHVLVDPARGPRGTIFWRTETGWQAR